MKSISRVGLTTLALNLLAASQALAASPTFLCLGEGWKLRINKESLRYTSAFPGRLNAEVAQAQANADGSFFYSGSTHEMDWPQISALVRPVYGQACRESRADDSDEWVFQVALTILGEPSTTTGCCKMVKTN